MRSFGEKKTYPKIFARLFILVNIFKRLTFFNIINMKFVGQRALNLILVKVGGGLKKKCATSAFLTEVCASAHSPYSTPPGVKPLLNFDGR